MRREQPKAIHHDNNHAVHYSLRLFATPFCLGLNLAYVSKRGVWFAYGREHENSFSVLIAILMHQSDASLETTALVLSLSMREPTSSNGKKIRFATLDLGLSLHQYFNKPSERCYGFAITVSETQWSFVTSSIPAINKSTSDGSRHAPSTTKSSYAASIDRIAMMSWLKQGFVRRGSATSSERRSVYHRVAPTVFRDAKECCDQGANPRPIPMKGWFQRPN